MRALVKLVMFMTTLTLIAVFGTLVARGMEPRYCDAVVRNIEQGSWYCVNPDGFKKINSIR